MPVERKENALEQQLKVLGTVGGQDIVEFKGSFVPTDPGMTDYLLGMNKVDNPTK